MTAWGSTPALPASPHGLQLQPRSTSPLTFNIIPHEEAGASVTRSSAGGGGGVGGHGTGTGTDAWASGQGFDAMPVMPVATLDPANYPMVPALQAMQTLAARTGPAGVATRWAISALQSQHELAAKDTAELVEKERRHEHERKEKEMRAEFEKREKELEAKRENMESVYARERQAASERDAEERKRLIKLLSEKRRRRRSSSDDDSSSSSSSDSDSDSDSSSGSSGDERCGSTMKRKTSKKKKHKKHKKHKKRKKHKKHKKQS